MAFAGNQNALGGGTKPAAAPYAPSTPTGFGGGVLPPRFIPSPGYVNDPGIAAGLGTNVAPPANGPQSGPSAQPGPTPGPQPLAPYLTDPGYQASLSQEQMGLGQLDAALKSARERAIIDFGDPSLASLAGFGLDPQSAAFARQNYLSGNAQLARLDKTHDLNRQAVINQLASHGILDSGDLGYKEQTVDQGYGNDLYDAKQKLLDYLNGVTSQDLQSRQNLHNGVIGAIQQAYQNFLNHPELYPSMPDQNGSGAANTGNAGSVAAGAGIGALLGAHAPHINVPVATHAAVQHRLNAYSSGQKRSG